MPLDQTTLTDAAEIRKRIECAARYLSRSMEAKRGLMRAHYCERAADELLVAAATADGAESRILACHCRIAQSLAEQFYGDGMGVSRLLDELRAMCGQ